MGVPFVWSDLTATDSGSVSKFYSDLFGWSVGTGAGGSHGWIIGGDQPWAGIASPDRVSAGRWVPYVVVEDLEGATKQALTLGGSLVQEAAKGPAGTAVILADPSEAFVALFVPAAD